MNLPPRVSIIMPAFNAAETIAVSIESVLGQTFDNWELLVINDGSTDHTLDVIRQFDDDRIRVLSKKNEGVAAARNTGLRQANGEFVAFLDSDDLWLAPKLEKQIALFDRYGGELGLVYTKYRGFTADSVQSFSIDVDTSIGYDNDYHRLLIMDYVPTLTVMIRASLISDIGYFREDLRAAEDWDYWIRIAESFDLKRVNEVMALYRISPNSLSSNQEKQLSEEWKVISSHVIASTTLPQCVISMSVIFWRVKKIRYLVRVRAYMNAIREIGTVLQQIPSCFRNLFFIIKYFLERAYQLGGLGKIGRIRAGLR